MKKFIEDDFSVDCHTPLKAVQSIVVMLLTAPFKLVMTISSKILYLPKEAIVMSVRNSFLVSAIITVAIVAGELYTNSFSLFAGKIPVVMLAAVTLFLAFLYIVVNATDFSAYTELNSLLSLQEGEQRVEQQAEPQAEPQVGVQAEVQAEQAMDGEDYIVDDLSFGEDDITVPLPSQPIPQSAPAPQVFSVNVAENFKFDSIDAGAVLPEEQLQAFVAMLEKSTEPSEFLSEAILQNFNPDEEVADDGNLDYLGLGVIPNNFKALT